MSWNKSQKLYKKHTINSLTAPKSILYKIHTHTTMFVQTFTLHPTLSHDLSQITLGIICGILSNTYWYTYAHVLLYVDVCVCTSFIMFMFIITDNSFVHSFRHSFMHSFIHSFIVLRFCVYLFDPVFIHWFMWFLPQFLIHPLPTRCYCKAWRRIFHVHCFYILYIFSFIVCYLIMGSHMIRITHTYVFIYTLLVLHCLHILFNV